MYREKVYAVIKKMAAPNNMTYAGREWLRNGREVGAGGAHAKLLENLRDEPHVYLQVHSKNGRLYGGMPVEELVEFAAHNRHLYEIVPTIWKRKFYIEYDKEVVNAGRSIEEHERDFKRLHEKGLADAENICGPGRAVMSGSWGHKGDNVKYSLHVVRPDTFFLDHGAALAMRAIAARLEADGVVYNQNQIFKLPNQSKLRDGRVHRLITGKFQADVSIAIFDEDAIEPTLDIPPPPPSPHGGRAIAVAEHRAVPLAPWPNPREPVPDI